MTQWHLTNVPGSAINLSSLGSIPFELDPHWLNSRINSPDKYVQYFIQGDQYHPCGYAPFFVHPGNLDFRFGEITLARIPVRRYAIQGAPLCEDYSSLAELFKCLREKIDTSNVVFFEGVVTGSALDKLLTENGSPVFNLFHVVPYGPTYERRLIELPAGTQFEDYLQKLGSGARTNLRHAIKNFKTMTTKNTVKVTCYTEPEQADELITILTQISHRTYQHHLLNLGFENNPEQLVELRSAASGGWLRAYVLWIDEAAVAFNIGYHHGHTFYGHHMGYDPEFCKLQPGIYLLAEVITDLLSNSIYCLDFLSGDSLFKRRLSNTSRKERHYYLIPRGWPGTAYALSLSASNFLSEKIGNWLDKIGFKSRIKRSIRDRIVTKRSVSTPAYPLEEISSMPVPRTSSAATVSVEDSVDSVDWKRLMPTIRPGNRFLSLVWFQSWESAFLNTGNWQGPVRYMTVRLNGRLFGVLPFVVQRLSIVRFLSLPGYYWPFRDLPVKAGMEDQVINSMVCRMAHVKGVVGVRIGPVENCSPTLLSLKDSFRQHGWTIIEFSRGALQYLELPKNVADYVPMISGRAKKAGYYLRRFKRRGDVSITVKTGLSSNEWQETLHELQKIESESWVAASGEPRFMGEKNFRFWRGLLQDCGLSRSIKIWILYLDDDPVSFCLVLDTGSIRYQLVNGYSKSVKQYSTGHILFKEMILDAIETGVERICFGQGDPGHKREWGAKSPVQLIDLIAMKPGLFGKLASVAHNTRMKFVK